MRFALGLAVLGWVCLPATSQTFDSETGNTIPWPADTWTGAVTRMVPCDLTGDLYRDVVVLDGTQLVLAFAPGLFTGRSTLGPSGVSDFCVIPKVTSDGFDCLVVADSVGWRKTWINYPDPPAEPDGDSVYSAYWPATQNSNWTNAKSLQALIPSTGSPSVVALNAAGSKILLLTNPFGNSPQTTSFNLAGSLALAAVDWDGNGTPEVAVLRTQSLQVYAPPSTTAVAN